jgi:hypothetical protein
VKVIFTHKTGDGYKTGSGCPKRLCNKQDYMKNMKININSTCKSIRSGDKKEKENSINLVISILESKDEINEQLQSAIQDCISAVTEVATKTEIDNGKYPIARFFRTVTGDDRCVLCENDISTLLERAIQSDTDRENYKSILKIVNIIALNQPSALVSHRDELENVLSGISDNTVDKQELQWGLETVAKLSSFDDSFMPIAVRVFTEAL